jgi:hypothetical protein
MLSKSNTKVEQPMADDAEAEVIVEDQNVGEPENDEDPLGYRGPNHMKANMSCYSTEQKRVIN